MAPVTIPGKIIIFTWKLAHIFFIMYEFQINHDFIIFDDVSNKLHGIKYGIHKLIFQIS